MSHIESRFGRSIMVVRFSGWSRAIGVMITVVSLAIAAWILFLFDGDIDSEYSKDKIGIGFLLFGVFDKYRIWLSLWLAFGLLR